MSQIFDSQSTYNCFLKIFARINLKRNHVENVFFFFSGKGVGKSSLMYRFSEDYFAPNLMPTAGYDFLFDELFCSSR